MVAFQALLHLLVPAALAASVDCPSTPANPPVLNYAVVLFPGFEALDVIGPLDPLEFISTSQHAANLHIIAETLDPVRATSQNGKLNSSWPFAITPSITFDEALSSNLEIDVLIVPGGGGVRAPPEELEPVVNFVRETFPRVEYLLTICTGSAIAARAGVLDGRRATTNKKAWGTVTPLGPDVEWVSPARYVIDGNVWSSSGVTAGIDLIFAFIRKIYGDATADLVLGVIEYTPHAHDDDPWSAVHGVPVSPPEEEEDGEED